MLRPIKFCVLEEVRHRSKYIYRFIILVVIDLKPQRNRDIGCVPNLNRTDPYRTVDSDQYESVRFKLGTHPSIPKTYP
jgi:hypothetical protein